MTNLAAQALAMGFLLNLANCGRQDLYAVRIAKKKQPVRYQPERRPISEATIKEHLSGRSPIAIYPLIGSSTRLAVIDLDDHDGEPDFDAVRQPARALVTHLQAEGLKPICFQSGGGRGIHIWIIWQGHKVPGIFGGYCKKP